MYLFFCLIGLCVKIISQYLFLFMVTSEYRRYSYSSFISFVMFLGSYWKHTFVKKGASQSYVLIKLFLFVMPSLLKIKAFVYLFCFYIFIIFIGIYEEHLDHNIVKDMFSFSMPSLLKIKAFLYFYVSYFYNFLLVFYEEHLDPNIVKDMLSCSWCFIGILWRTPWP